MPRMPEEYRESRKGGNGHLKKYQLHKKHHARLFTCIILFDPHNSVRSVVLSHLPEKETDSRKTSTWSKVTGGIQTCLQNVHFLLVSVFQKEMYTTRTLEESRTGWRFKKEV